MVFGVDRLLRRGKTRVGQLEVQAISILRELHSQGEPLATIAERLNCSVATVSQFALMNGLRRKQTLTDDQKQEIQKLADAYPVREIARRVQCSRSQAGHYVIFWREREAKRRGELSTRRLNTPRKCPKHGRITIWPCVACAAETAAKTRTVNDD